MKICYRLWLVSKDSVYQYGNQLIMITITIKNNNNNNKNKYNKNKHNNT